MREIMQVAAEHPIAMVLFVLAIGLALHWCLEALDKRKPR